MDKNLMLIFPVWFFIWFLGEPFLWQQRRKEIWGKNTHSLHFECTSVCSK